MNKNTLETIICKYRMYGKEGDFQVASELCVTMILVLLQKQWGITPQYDYDMLSKEVLLLIGNEYTKEQIDQIVSDVSDNYYQAFLFKREKKLKDEKDEKVIEKIKSEMKLIGAMRKSYMFLANK